MDVKSLRTGIAAGIGLLILIFDGKTAVTGMNIGIELCLNAVIPSLFPFLVLTTLLTGSLSGIPIVCLRPVCRSLGIPQGAEPLLVCSLLGGYPSGAQAVAEYHRSGILNRKDAQRILSFSSNAGPSFIFGMASSLFPEAWIPWALWGIHLVSAFLTARLLYTAPSPARGQIASTSISLSTVLFSALRTMAAICGWVVLFRVVISFCDRWFLWLFSDIVRIALIGALELSNGCVSLSAIDNWSLRFLLCSGILSWGGLCVTMQTCSVIQSLSIRSYLLGKLIQTVLSLMISVLIISGHWFVCFAGIVPLALYPRKRQKSSSIPVAVGV